MVPLKNGCKIHRHYYSSYGIRGAQFFEKMNADDWIVNFHSRMK